VRRAVVITALTAVILGGSPASQGHQVSTRPLHVEAEATKKASRGPCAEIRWKFLPWSDHENHVRSEEAIEHRLVPCAVARWPVPGGVKKAQAVPQLADYEHYGWAKPKNWAKWFPAWPHVWRFNARATVMGTIYHVSTTWSWGYSTCA
jgi:hypothetical protein